MIVFVLSLDSMLSVAKDRKITGLGKLVSELVDHVMLLTQDTFNFADSLTGIKHVPCAFSRSKRVRWILLRFKYLRWFYFFISSFIWLIKHRSRINLLIGTNVDSPAPLLFRMLFGLPYVIYYHYDVAFQVQHINRNSIAGILLLGLERFAFRRASAVWITSPSLMVKVKRFGARRIKIIPNWIDIKEIEELPSFKKRSDEFRILFAGRLHRVKQVDLLIRAFYYLYKINPSVNMYILGDGEERQKLIALTNDLGLRDSIHFLGLVDRRTVFEMMKQADVFVLPSRLEGNPRVLIEAMVSKVPIVATNVPGIRDMVQHMITGYLIDHHQPEELARAIEYVLRNKQDSANMVKRAYAFAKHNFSKEGVSQKIFDELLLLVPKYRSTEQKR